jgi:hypothetical protein
MTKSATEAETTGGCGAGDTAEAEEDGIGGASIRVDELDEGVDELLEDCKQDLTMQGAAIT